MLQKDRLYIILLDEPETHLDGRFICSTLLRQIRELKETVQIIAVTHNANLVALSKADHIILMDKSGPNEASKPLQGSFEDLKDKIVKLLEGGARAFQKRGKLYDLPPLDELGDDELGDEEAGDEEVVVGEEDVAW